MIYAIYPDGFRKEAFEVSDLDLFMDVQISVMKIDFSVRVYNMFNKETRHFESSAGEIQNIS
jgi:hypothetical protein